ncbi:MAG: T9SS type A sorting domain-containing protein [Saprospiraceae bacterium]
MKSIFASIFLLIFSIQSAITQEYWTRLDRTKDLAVTDVRSKQDGTVYFSIKGSQHIYTFNILEKSRNYSELPNVIKLFPISNDDNLYLNLDFDKSLIVSMDRFGIYNYIGSSFSRPILKDTNEYPRIYDLANIKFDKFGKLFFREGNYIFFRPEKWSWKGESKIFEQPGYIRNFFPYSDSVNYSIHSENGITDIYKYNSTNGSSRKLVILPYEVSSQSLINENGDMMLCAGQELYYYKKDGEELVVPLIDSSTLAFGEVNGIFQSLSDNGLICYKTPSFYVTYDSCKTWTKVNKFSKDIPTGTIDKFIFWDTSHALILTSLFCGAKELFEINTESQSWNRVLPGLSNYNFSRISNFSNEFIAYHECFFRKSINGGHDWNFIKAPNIQDYYNYNNYVRISEQNKGQIIFTFKVSQDTLYRSLDFGSSWVQNVVIKNIKQLFRISPTELFLLSEVGTTGKERTNFHYSNDNGNTWQLKTNKTEFINQITSIKYDIDGNLILFYSSHSPTKVYKSTDKGLSWNLDSRFDRFGIKDIIFENDGRCIINGFDESNNISGLFASYDFKNYINLSSSIDNNSISNFKVLGKGKYVGFAGGSFRSNERGIFFTDDDGVSWKNISYNLPDFHSSEKVYEVSDIIVDDQGFLHVSLTYDGFWRYNTNLVSTNNIQKKMIFELYPNPVSESLMIRVPEEFQEAEIHYVLLDMLGIVVLERNLKGSAILDVTQLSSGTYILQVYSDNKMIYSDKILKY